MGGTAAGVMYAVILTTSQISQWQWRWGVGAFRLSIIHFINFTIFSQTQIRNSKL